MLVTQHFPLVLSCLALRSHQLHQRRRRALSSPCVVSLDSSSVLHSSVSSSWYEITAHSVANSQPSISSRQQQHSRGRCSLWRLATRLLVIGVPSPAAFNAVLCRANHLTTTLHPPVALAPSSFHVALYRLSNSHALFFLRASYNLAHCLYESALSFSSTRSDISVSMRACCIPFPPHAASLLDIWPTAAVALLWRCRARSSSYPAPILQCL